MLDWSLCLSLGELLMGEMGDIRVYTHTSTQTHHHLWLCFSSYSERWESQPGHVKLSGVCVRVCVQGGKSLKDRPCGAPFAKSIRCCFYSSPLASSLISTHPTFLLLWVPASPKFLQLHLLPPTHTHTQTLCPAFLTGKTPYGCLSGVWACVWACMCVPPCVCVHPAGTADWWDS